jgi:hypothetical protein
VAKNNFTFEDFKNLHLDSVSWRKTTSHLRTLKLAFGFLVKAKNFLTLENLILAFGFSILAKNILTLEDLKLAFGFCIVAKNILTLKNFKTYIWI